MKMKKAKIEQRINELIKESENNRGPKPKLFDEPFRIAFVEAVLNLGDNGKQVHDLLNSRGFFISYKQCHEYMRRLFGTYPETGRPPKYMRETQRRVIA